MPHRFSLSKKGNRRGDSAESNFLRREGEGDGISSRSVGREEGEREGDSSSERGEISSSANDDTINKPQLFLVLFCVLFIIGPVLGLPGLYTVMAERGVFSELCQTKGSEGSSSATTGSSSASSSITGSSSNANNRTSLSSSPVIAVLRSGTSLDEAIHLVKEEQRHGSTGRSSSNTGSSVEGSEGTGTQEQQSERYCRQQSNGMAFASEVAVSLMCAANVFGGLLYDLIGGHRLGFATMLTWTLATIVAGIAPGNGILWSVAQCVASVAGGMCFIAVVLFHLKVACGERRYSFWMLVITGFWEIGSLWTNILAYYFSVEALSLWQLYVLLGLVLGVPVTTGFWFLFRPSAVAPERLHHHHHHHETQQEAAVGVSTSIQQGDFGAVGIADNDDSDNDHPPALIIAASPATPMFCEPQSLHPQFHHFPSPPTTSRTVTSSCSPEEEGEGLLGPGTGEPVRYDHENTPQPTPRGVGRHSSQRRSRDGTFLPKRILAKLVDAGGHCCGTFCATIKDTRHAVQGILSSSMYWIVVLNVTAAVVLYFYLANVSQIIIAAKPSVTKSEEGNARSVVIYLMGSLGIANMIPGRLVAWLGISKGLPASCALQLVYILIYTVVLTVVTDPSLGYSDRSSSLGFVYGGYAVLFMWRVAAFGLSNMTIPAFFGKEYPHGVGTAFGLSYTIAGFISVGVGSGLTKLVQAAEGNTPSQQRAVQGVVVGLGAFAAAAQGTLLAASIGYTKRRQHRHMHRAAEATTTHRLRRRWKEKLRRPKLFVWQWLSSSFSSFGSSSASVTPQPMSSSSQAQYGSALCAADIDRQDHHARGGGEPLPKNVSFGRSSSQHSMSTHVSNSEFHYDYSPDQQQPFLPS